MNARSTAETPRRSHCRENGSAYLFVLLGLLVLTVIGLSLVVVTQTEVQIGGAEKSAMRVLYGADSGLQIQLAIHQVDAPKAEARQVELIKQSFGFGDLQEVVDFSRFAELRDGACALCSTNHSKNPNRAVNYGMTSHAKRQASCTEPPQARKLVSAMYYIEPEIGRSPSTGTSGAGVGLPDREPSTTLISSSSPSLATGTCEKGLADVIY